MTLLFDGLLLADYFQFYLADGASVAETSTDWTEEALKARLLLAEGNCVVMTARNMPVPVRVEWHERQPQIDLDKTDHIVVGGLSTAGEIVIAGLTDYWPDAPRAKIPAGALCLMAVSTGLGTLNSDGLDGDDRYVVHLWPGRVNAVTVLRQWPGD